MANIVTSSDGDSEQHIVETALKCLGLDEKLPEEKVIEHCITVKSECSKGLAEKMLATKHDGYNILVKIALKEDQKKASLEAVKVDYFFSLKRIFRPLNFCVSIFYLLRYLSTKDALY